MRLRFPWLCLWLCVRCSHAVPAAPCARDDDCPNGECAASELAHTADLQPPTLHCLPNETGDGAGPGAPCEQASDCDRRLCLVSGYCTQACVQADDCALSSDCGQGLVLGVERSHPQQVCLPRPPTAFEAGGITYDVRPILGPLHDQPATISLVGTDRPAVYIVQYLGTPAWPFSGLCRPPLCPLQLRAKQHPDPPLYDLSTADSQTDNPIAQWPFAFPLTVYVGNGAAPTYDDEGYLLTLLSETAGDLRITQVRRTTTAVAPENLQIDLDFYYVGTTLAPSGERGPQPLALALDELERIFSAAGIAVGAVRQRTVPGAIVDRGLTFADEDPRAGFGTLRSGYGVWPELPALLRLSAGSGARAVPLFLIADIEGMGDGAVQALSGGIPGPLGVHGTGASGIAIATDTLLAKPSALGRTLAHELGHFLGLMHTTEYDGSAHDPLTDTPACPLAADGDGDGRLTSDECTAYDGQNLLFWAQSSGVALSTSQIRVLRQAPILY